MWKHIQAYICSLTNFLGKKNQWITEVFIVFIAAILIAFTIRIFLNWFVRQGERKKKHKYLRLALQSCVTPITLLILWFGIVTTLAIIRSHIDYPDLLAWLDSGKSLGFIISLFTSLIFFVSKIEKYHIKQKTHDLTTTILISRAVTIALIFFGIILTLQILQIPMSGILAFGSAGTLIIGFASRNLIENFFGSFMIFTDRPFTVGEYIQVNPTIAGTVDSIGWRSTRLISLNRQPIYVPNATFLSNPIENMSRRENRRITVGFGLRYDNFERVPEIINKIEAILKIHPRIDRIKFTPHVAFEAFTDSTLNLTLYCLSDTGKLVDAVLLKNDLSVKVAQIVAESGAGMAFKTITLDIPDATLKALSVR